MTEAFEKLPNKCCPRCGRLFYGLRKTKWCPKCTDPEIRHTPYRRTQSNIRCVGCHSWFSTSDKSWPVCWDCLPSLSTKHRWTRSGWIHKLTLYDDDFVDANPPPPKKERARLASWAQECAHCGLVFTTNAPRALWCGPCKENVPRSERKGGKVYEVSCVSCLFVFETWNRGQTRCELCKAKRQRRLERARAAKRNAVPVPIEDRVYRKDCRQCGGEFVVSGGAANTRFCPECALERRHASLRASKLRMVERGGKTLAELGLGDGRRGRPRKSGVAPAPPVCEASGMRRGIMERARKLVSTGQAGPAPIRERGVSVAEVRRDQATATVQVGEVRAEAGGRGSTGNVPAPEEAPETSPPEPEEGGEDAPQEDESAPDPPPVETVEAVEVGPSEAELADPPCVSCGEAVDRVRPNSGLCFDCWAASQR